jgi:hypothetical protein
MTLAVKTLFDLNQGPELCGQLMYMREPPTEMYYRPRRLEFEERYAHFCRFLMLVAASRLARSQCGLSRAAAGDHAKSAWSARDSL